MPTIGFDFTLLSKPYRLRRCTSQLIHMALVAERLGCDVRCITNAEHLSSHPEMSLVKHLQTTERSNVDIYIAKADTFYRDSNWELISKLSSFKVCLCNSDKTFRETNTPFGEHHGTPVQFRCDLYMPCNYLASTAEYCGGRLIPAAHPPTPQVLKAFRNAGLLNAYLDDDVDAIRKHFYHEEKPAALFVGGRAGRGRAAIAAKAPPWAVFQWTTSLSGNNYIAEMSKYVGVLDLPGCGDKNIRLIEGAILGKTIITSKVSSNYDPPLLDHKNCLIVDWGALSQIVPDIVNWRRLAVAATDSYRAGWSIRSQVIRIIEAARGIPCKTIYSRKETS